MSKKEKRWRGVGESAEISAPDPRIGEYIPLDDFKKTKQKVKKNSLTVEIIIKDK